MTKIFHKFPDEEVEGILLVPDFTTDFIDKKNYFSLYFKAAFTQARIKCNQQIPYESVEIVSSQLPEEIYDSTGSDTDGDLEALMEEELFE